MSRPGRTGNNRRHVSVRKIFDGDIVRTIETSRRRSAFALADKLNNIGENDLTVYTTSPNRGKAGQVVEGRKNHVYLFGFYTGDLSTVWPLERLRGFARGEIAPAGSIR